MDYYKIFTLLLILFLIYKFYQYDNVSENFENNSTTLVDDWNAINQLAQLSKKLMAGGITIPGNLSVAGNLTLASGNKDVGALLDNLQAQISNLQEKNTNLQAQITQLNSNNNILMGVNRIGEIFYADQNINSNPNWKQVPGILTNVSYSNGQAYGVNGLGELFYASNFRAGNWVKIPGWLSQVSFK